MVDNVSKENSTPYSYFTDELTQQVKDTLMEKLGYTETQAQQPALQRRASDLHHPGSEALQAIVDEEVNDPSNYSARPLQPWNTVFLSTHADGTTEHYL